MHPVAISMVLQQKCRKSLWFCRRDIYAGMVCTLADIRFEMVAILYNIGALHSQLGASDSRVTADGMKLSCTHFQCAAWAFQVFLSAAYSCIFHEKFLVHNIMRFSHLQFSKVWSTGT